MNLRYFLVKNRFFIALALIALGAYVNATSGFWPAFILYLVGLLTLVFHFMVGPITLIQKLVENGDLDRARVLLDGVKHPKLLYKPIRSAYYMLQSNFATLNEDYDKAEEDIRRSLESGQADPNLGGTAYLQLGMLAMKKGDTKEAYKNLMKAVKEGIPDKESEAGAYLQLSSLNIQRRNYKAAKNFYRKAKSLKPTTSEIKSQLKEMEKYISRIPG